VRLQARVENELGRGVPLAVFFQAPTVRELAIALAGSSVPTHGLHMSASETLEGRPTLFYLHFLSQAQHLAKYFGPQWPVYGISAPYDEELHLWHEHHRLAISMEELAMRCLPMIQRLQPKGPYFLAGGCFGGVLAFEVACQLSRLGEETALLALLDAYYIPGCKRLQFPNVRRWTYHGFRTLSTGINYPLTKWRKRQKLAKERHRQIEGALDRDRRSSEEDSKRIRLPQAEFMGQILKQYKATPYAGGAVLIRSTADPSFAFDPGATNGWEAVIQGNLFVEDLNCGHADISEDPHITEAARRLEKYLSKAGAGFIASKALPVASQSTQTMQAVRL
jgi:thioesterase domain-containing protein